MPYSFRTLAHRPEIFRTATAHMEAVLKTGTLPRSSKSSSPWVTSQLDCTAYCLASHTALSLKLGWTPEHLETLKSWRDSSLFSEAEKEAIHLAEATTNDSLYFTDADIARLRCFYSEGEVVERMAAIGLFNQFNRFNNLLQMEPTRPATAEELREAGVEPVTA